MRVSEQFLQCVVFICVPKTLINGNKDVSFIGTGFYVSFPSTQNPNETYLYLVTAKHVAEKLTNKNFLIRMNTKRGSFKYIESGGREWFYHPTDDSVDVAVMSCSPALLYELKSISSNNFLTDEIISQKKVGLGDEVFITVYLLMLVVLKKISQ